MYARFLIALLLLSSVARATDVYIIAGQSNAIGGAVVATLDAEDPELKVPQASLAQYRLLVPSYQETSDWIPLQPRNGKFYGAELSFGQAMQQRTGEPIAIIKVAASGTNLTEEWNPANDLMYPWMIDKVQTSLATLPDHNLAGFIWIHGEGDTGILSRAADYDDNFLAFAAAVRADLGAPSLPFVLNEGHADLNRYFLPEFRESQRNAAAADPNIHLVNADDLALGYDNVHFTPEMHVELGRRFADVFAPSGDFNADGVIGAADLAAWRSSLGRDRAGDSDADGSTSGADFLLWQRQTRIPGGADFLTWQRQLGVPNAIAAVPEPAGAWLALSGLAALRRRR